MGNRTGVMLVGALGHLSTTVMIGAAALKKGLCPATGMVTALADFAGLSLPDPGGFVFGGWDIRSGSVTESARCLLSELYHFPLQSAREIETELAPYEKNMRPGTLLNCGKAVAALSEGPTGNVNETAQDAVSRLKNDIRCFKTENDLENVVVVNLASTEPPVCEDDALPDEAGLSRALSDSDARALRSSTLYAYAAVASDCVFINFTPSNAALPPGIVALAEGRGLPIMGNDGKTGETLVKSALAPMFAYRNLQVLSWEGYNILGNMDGRILDCPENKASKVKSKDGVLPRVLGYAPHSRVSIDYVPSLGDMKTAWDFIHFEGFLNTRMSLQFTWQGCDSALAAPLVLDLIRLGAYARLKGEKGLMPHLASFFKAPMGVDTQNLHAQFDLLAEYAARHARVV